MSEIAKDKKILNKKNISQKNVKKLAKNVILNVSTVSKNTKLFALKNKRTFLLKGLSKNLQMKFRKSLNVKYTIYSNVNNSNLNKVKKKSKDFLVEFYDLPYMYNKTIVKILAQTPETLFVYWEISDDDKNFLIKKYGDNFFETTTPFLKVHNLTKNYTFEIPINDFANCWYLHVNDSKCVYEIELDRKFNNLNFENQYVFISSSNNIELPNDHILLEQNLSNVQFKNVKTNNIISVDINKNTQKIYNIENLYKLFYTKEELNNFKNLSNPSSGNPTSTFK